MQTFVGTVVFVGSIVESHDVDCISKARGDDIIPAVHTCSAEACGVKTMHQVLHLDEHLSALAASLFGYFVAYRPHHNRRV